MYCALCEGVGALHAMEGGSHTDLTDLTDRADVKSAKGVEIYNCCFEKALADWDRLGKGGDLINIKACAIFCGLGFRRFCTIAIYLENTND